MQTIRPPRGIVRVGDELFAEARDADSLLERLGFFIERDELSFPEEMLSLTAETEAEAEAKAETEAKAKAKAKAETEAKTLKGTKALTHVKKKTQPPYEFPLPDSWLSLGFSIPNPNRSKLSRTEIRSLAFAFGTKKPMSEWERLVQIRRTHLRLPGDNARPLDWSTQDWYVIADINSANILFVEDNPLRINRWIQPANSTVTHLDKQGYMVFWGPEQMLVSCRNPFYSYKFPLVELPADLQMLLTSATIKPVPEVEARGFVNGTVSDFANGSSTESDEEEVTGAAGAAAGSDD